MASTIEKSTRPEAFANVRDNWGWFLLLGVMFLTLGAIAVANLLYATIAVVLYVGALMALAGVAQLLHAFRVRTWGGSLLWLASGLLYAAAGVMAFIDPTLASIAFTLSLAVLTVAAGVVRLLLGFRARPNKGWGWLIASGAVTTLAGLVFLTGWPVNSVWLLGLFLAIDLMFQGITLIGFACQWGTVS